MPPHSAFQLPEGSEEGGAGDPALHRAQPEQGPGGSKESQKQAMVDSSRLQARPRSYATTEQPHGSVWAQPHNMGSALVLEPRVPKGLRTIEVCGLPRAPAEDMQTRDSPETRTEAQLPPGCPAKFKEVTLEAHRPVPLLLLHRGLGQRPAHDCKTQRNLGSSATADSVFKWLCRCDSTQRAGQPEGSTQCC